MTDFVRDVVRRTRPYVSQNIGLAIDLSDNTSLWGPPPAAVHAVQTLAADALARYPELPPTAFYRALSAYAGVSPDMVVAGCGSDDLIDCAMRTFAEPGAVIAFASPTFSMVPAFATINGLCTHTVPYRPDLDLDVEALLHPRPQLVYLCSPNNPTGGALPRATIERVLRESSGIVILDEAYGEFTDAPGFALVQHEPRLVVMRTLSKAFGLAGLRIGYAVLEAGLARALETVRGPYKLNVAAGVAATAALQDGLPWVRAQVTEGSIVRHRVVDRLRAAGFSPLPSDANFVCMPCRDAAGVASRLLARGFGVRVLDRLPPLTPALAQSAGAAIRFAIGPWPVMERLLGELTVEAPACA